MGKKSVRENKNIYQLSREELNLTREQASQLMDYVSADRIEKIESEKCMPHPDDILAMSKAYKAPNLCNYYCSHECSIGKESIPEVSIKELSQITLEMLASLNTLQKEKDRLVEITVDGKISADEYDDFATIKKHLEEISLTIDSLKLWVNKTIADGGIEKDAFN